MGRRNRFVRRDVSMLGLLLVGLMLASCGSSASTPAASTPAAAGAASAPAASQATAAAPAGEAAEKVVIWSGGDSGPVQDWNADPILRVVEEKTGTDIEFVKLTSETYVDQVNAAIASGNVPDIIGCIDHNNKQLINQWVRDGVVASFDGELAPLLKNVLAEYNEMPGTDELMIDGKIYMKPINWETRPWWGNVIHVRKDLLDKYQMQVPDTFEQYFAFLRAAKNDGQSGALFNGSEGLGGILDPFVGAYGVPPGGWVKTGDAWDYWAIQPGTKNGLLLFRKMVAEGLVDPASWELEGTPRDQYVAGQGASMIWNGGGHTGRIQNDMDLAGKGAKELTIPAPDAGAGSRGYAASPPFYCASFITQMEGNNPKAAARVLDYLASEEGLQLTVLGVEGIDYEGSGDNIKLLPARGQRGFPVEAGDTGAHPLATQIVSWVPQKWQGWQLLYGKDQAFKQWYEEMLANQSKYLIETRGTISTSPLWTEFSSVGDELVNRSFLEIVKAPDEQQAAALFDQFVQDWKGAGGDAASAEMSTVLNQIYK